MIPPDDKMKKPLQPRDFFGQFDTVPDTFGNVKTKETTRQLPSFNAKEFGRVTNPTPYDDLDALTGINAAKQTYSKQAENAAQQFGANFLSGFGQGIANLVDVASWGNDNYQSSLFGLSTKEMHEWATGVAQRNKIERENPGSFNPGDFGWFMEQLASSGTGVGMAFEALAETVAIELSTGGLGTGAAIARLGKLFKNSKGISKGAEAFNAIKDLRSTATVYGTLNRLNESRMEAMMSYDEIKTQMSSEKNTDGSAKYTEEQINKMAAEGADRTYQWNLALLPLDILAYRTMVFNPVSGSAKGFIEKGLSKIANKTLRKGVQGLTFAGLEGAEEGFQFVGSEEGKHYAKVLGGMDDASTFGERFLATSSTDEFWNNFAGGVIGSPVIGGAMKLANKVISGNRTARINSTHKDYVQNIAKMDDVIAKQIIGLQEEGKAKEADVLRRRFRASKALSALHLDAMTDKSSAFEGHLNFLESTLEEVNKGNLSSLQDLGFLNPTTEQVDDIKNNFESSIKDAKELKTIYDNIKDKYSKNFIPQIAQSHFQINRLGEAQQEVNTKILELQGNLFQFNQLSPNGKAQYEAEYQLGSLIAEQKRLTEQFRSTENPSEKENVNQLIEVNKNKITTLKDTLNQIGKDDTYSKEERTIDNDILQSALKDKEYAQAIYDKEHIENAIALERKNLSLWNKPEYLAAKTNESIAKAKTKAQVANTEVTEENAKAISDKNSQIDSNAAAAEIQAQGTVVGNQDLFADDNTLISTIASAVTAPVQSNNNTNPENDSKEPEFLFNPAEFDFENSDEEAKNKVVAGVGGLLNKLGDISFEDLVRHIVKVQGVTVADTIYNALKYGWEKNGKAVEDYKAIYDKIFNNPVEQLMEGVQGLKTAEELAKASDEVTETVVAKQNNDVVFDNNNQPVYIYEGIVTNEASPKMAFSTRLSALIQTINEDGSISVEHEYIEDDLNQGEYVDSLQLLDPDNYDEGVELEVRVPANFNDIKIPVYAADGTKVQSMTFGAYVSQKNLKPTDQEYQDKLPMIIYKGNATKGVSFVHDIGWYHPLRFNYMKPLDMADAIAQTRAIRKEVLDSTNNKVPIIITGKRQTTFAGLKTKPDETITLKEANPETQLVVALSTDTLSTSKKNQVYPNGNTILVNQTPFRVGNIYEVRRYGKKDGVKTYISLPILRPKIDELTKSSVLQAITIYANRANTDTALRAKHKEVIEHIKSNMGLDITSESGLQKYLKHFITVFNTEKAKTNADVEAQAKSSLPESTPYIAFIAGGNIVFGQAGIKVNTKVSSFFINPNAPQSVGIALNALANNEIIVREVVNGKEQRNKYDRLGWYEFNLNLDNLNENKPIITIDKNLSTATTAPSYRDFLLERLHTNVRSYNIGTEEKPNWVTNVQPVITYQSKKILENLKGGTDVVAIPVTPDVPDLSTKADLKEISDLEKKIIEDAKKNLGNNFGISKDDSELYNPAILNDEQKEYITNDINRIAGLLPDQQFDIVDFMYNQIIALVNFETKQVTKDEINKAVDKAFKDVIEPLIQSYKDQIKLHEDILEKAPELKGGQIPDIINDYKFMLKKANEVKAGMKTLKEEAYTKVAKYTGITENRIETEVLNDEVPDGENPNPKTEEDENSKERDFWTDILQENPESRLSYTMRRFFGGIREYDRSGVPATGFLGLPTYVGSDIVTRNLMVLLADVPSDFDTMIAKLETMKDSLSWMPEVIAKLKDASNQTKQQFVTVMSNTSLRMKFTMLSFNRRTNSYTTKVYNTHLNGISESVLREWRSNLLDSDLVIPNEEGNYVVNEKKAKALIQRFESWKGIDLKVLEGNLSSLEAVRQQVKSGKAIFSPTDNVMAQFLRTNLVKNTDRVKVSMKGFNYQVTSLGNNRYKLEFLPEHNATKEEVENWLKEFGINLTSKTLDDLYKNGLYHNYNNNTFTSLFYDGENTNGLFGILYNRLKYLVDKGETILDEDGASPLQDSVITSLANLESKYNVTNVPFGFRDNGKSFFALTVPKFVTDRARDLKSTNSNIREQLKTISFSKNSFWLMLLQDEDFRTKFGISHIGANAFKELGQKLYKDNGINKLADIDHELTKLGMFWDSTQGEISYNGKNHLNEDATLKTYPGTSIEMRVGTMFSPTMSDKHMMTLVTTAVLNLRSADLNDGNGVTDEVAKILYEQTVKPELQRMVKFYQNGGATNISAYDSGAGMFLLMPEMNNIEYSPGLRLIDAIKHNSETFTDTFIDTNEDLKKAFNDKIKAYIKSLTDEKLEAWEKNGLLVSTNTEEALRELKFVDKKYADKFNGKNSEERARMAAMDFVVNSLIANANSFMLLAGDPAFYFKSKEQTDHIKMSKDTFVNAGKRLANQIAPGTAISNSENEKYIQIFLQDRMSTAENIEYLERILGVDKAAAYRKVEGSDAQEYTTWKEHLDIIAKLGKTPDNISDITPEDISEARELFASGIERKKLTERQLQLIGKVMQPLKPVYTGQIYDPIQDVMRTMYIKSSSFPLIPQLTAGMEIDKLRVAMEKIEKDRKMNVRASYQSANKVGAMNNPIEIWSSEGKLDEEALNTIGNSTLILDRKNFRIQQEVPFKSAKQGDDTISLGTQLMKLLFGDGMMEYEGFRYNGKTYNGRDLHKVYNETFINLIKEKKAQLYTELGLDETGFPVDIKKSMEKLQSILKDEAIKRGYPLQDIQGLTLNSDGEFNLPLWASSNSNRYESMLNSIVGNRIIKMKFPGNSFVAGSEEGFVKSDNLEGIEKSKIIFTSGWNGSHLQGTKNVDGTLKSAQILVGSKFKDSEGNLIDLLLKENGEYKYINKTDTGFTLKEDMFDKELLTKLSFRIPTSGHQSGSLVEIVGFLPFENADLIIVPRGFTKQKGLDFDVDKENAYQLWNFMTEDGKFETLQEKHRSEILARADKELQRVESGNSPIDKMLQAIFGGVSEYTEDDLKDSKFLTKLNSKITEKLMQNEIIKIHTSVFGNDNPQVQAKIAKNLNTDFAEAQAEFIDDLINIDKDDTYWTPLSDEYQKQKMIAGASGKIGTGAYSLDVVGHSLFQQTAMNGKPIILTEMIDDGEGNTIVQTKTWRFGNIESDGALGRTMTLDGERSISEVMSERQNIAVDNEKLQVMGRVGLNDITMDVDKLFNMIGFDKGGDGNSISFLFLSQPIIRKFVERMKNANSNVAEFNANREDDIVQDLIKEYGGTTEEITQEYWDNMSKQMTNENFITAIRADKPDGQLQTAVLRRFMEMRQYGIAIRGIQTTINTDSKGLGKSFFDVIEKRNALNKLGNGSALIQGAENLIGDYVDITELNNEQELELQSQGFINIGDFMVKPTTLSGAFNVEGVNTAYNLWNRHFPYDSKMVEKVFNEVVSIIGSENTSDSKMVEFKQKIFQGIKKYSSASNKTGIISTNDNINEQRARLFIDSDENTSLAKYIKGLLATTGNSVVDKFIKKNNLINRFEFDIQKNGQPSLIKFNNAAGEEFDEQYLYESLATLIEKRGKTGSVQLPKIGNKEYTLDTLAQDLIAYAYLGNATQEAIQFTKYVPVSYLNTVGYTKLMREAGKWFHTNANILGIKNTQDIIPPEVRHLVSEFTMQYVQHNPERVNYKLDNKTFGSRTLKIDDNSFQLKGEEKPIFISVYDASIPKGEKKFRLYWFDGSKYTRVPVLGTFGMDEYQPRTDIGQSLVNGRTKVKAEPQPAIKQDVVEDDGSTVFNLVSGNVVTILENIIKANTTRYTELAKALLPYATDLKVRIVKDLDGDTNFEGAYNPKTKEIIINDNIKTRPDLVANTVLHELVHHFTVEAIDKDISTLPNGQVVTSGDAPAHIVSLVRVFNNLIKQVGEDKINDLLVKIELGSGVTSEERSFLYPLTSMYEFVTMALTDKAFQDRLNSIPYKETGMTFLDKFKEIIQNVLTALGVKFDKDFTAAHAISAIFELIDTSNKKTSKDNPFGHMDTGFNEEQGPSEFDFNPAVMEYSQEDYAMRNVVDYISKLDSNSKKC